MNYVLVVGIIERDIVKAVNALLDIIIRRFVLAF
jgi:hypothetical protein